MTSVKRGSACLNCGAELSGPFCAQCGQRAIPAYPTLREMAGDAWDEFVGYDGRLVHTAKALPVPGLITLQTLEGHRARYISPLRLYLTASLIYFLIASVTPNFRPNTPTRLPGSTVVVDLSDEASVARLTAAERADLEKTIARAPAWGKPLLEALLNDPAGFRKRALETMPRVLFLLVPVFAGILALLFRRRPFTQHLIFALHLQAVLFLAMSIVQLSNFTRSLVLMKLAAIVVLGSFAAFALVAFRRVYGERWVTSVLKAAAVGVIYLAAFAAGLVGMIAWILLVR